MQGYLNEYSDIIKMPVKEICKEFRLIYLGGKLVEVFNFIKIIQYQPDIISLKVKNNVLNFEGSNLTIKELNKKDIIISGKINKFYLSMEI